MKLTTTTHVSVDGVMQGLGGPDEDRSGGFERGGWQGPLWDNEAGTFLNQVFERADAFLFGRRTYEIFAPYWGAITDPDDSIAGPLNARPKYVASTHAHRSDVVGHDRPLRRRRCGHRRAESQAGGELQVHGSGALIRWLLDHQLVDELTLFVHPVILGQGTRLFPDAGPDVALELVESRSTPKGITIQVYRPNGRPQYATATAG